MRLRIGFVGLGTIGEPIANNLRKAGHDLTVWNRTPSKAAHIVSKGGKLAGSARECATGRDLVITCVSDEKALDTVLEGPDGVLEALRDGDVLVDMSTAGVRAARSVSERAAARGAGFVACPVLGSRSAAEQAQLVLVAGGPAVARERARPALHAVSARIFELEDAAQAALMKLCVNAIGGAMITGFGEALALGQAGGVPVAKLVEVLQASSFHSPLYLMKGELVERRDWAPRFAIALAEKDQRLAQEAAADLGAKTPVNDTVRRVFADAAQSGRADKDIAAVAELFFEWVAKT
ncbi:NAD(P)-dependent oxidoreductase [Anaeromyxobacter sp. Fw109-5]|uniref:NAD(P)-dependent oxidoreductase n=1 Tax=Anaeromyxobacter sp. (strain Fw109-5) TaxID=404589 RepID=UPI0000ED7786|nr:NAD(P)-dependent oxidoreductase [Anaeromyxobacter sp. Fw109-5]ABS24841.1 6-phosphogluconate dehydrogenase NAD-binding [Anaeromyxobacter sp. Fw109-5]